MWKDISSYSKNDKERNSNCFELRQGGLRLVIVSNHLAYRGTDILWALTCSPWFDIKQLEAQTAEDAKNEALRLVKHKIASLYIAFHEKD